MKPLSLRARLVLTLVPLLLLVLLLGSLAVAVIYNLGGRIDAILRENYDSVIAMERLNEAVERIDSSFQFAIAGDEKNARQQYAETWPEYMKSLELERENITLPGEADLVRRLDAATATYRQQGERFYTHLPGDPKRREEYFRKPGGLLATFKEIKGVAASIARLNQDNMEEASRHASRLARNALLWFAGGLALVVVLLAFIMWPIRAILRPIKNITDSVLAIGAGNLDQVVPVTSHDELGQLAGSFNTMARQLRDYRQTSYSRLLRAQRTSQATINSFPDPVLVVDSEGYVEMANPAARRLLGVHIEKDEQRSRFPWQPPESLRQPLAEALVEQQPYLPKRFDKAITLRSENEEHCLLPQILPIRDPFGNTLGAAVLFQDVTRFRLLDKVKSDLVATVSHELKTPLTSVRLAVHLLLEEAVGPLTPKQLELLLDARENAERLLTQVNNLLDLTRLEQGAERLELKPEAPRELLARAAEEIQPRTADKGLTLEIEPSAELPLVAADPERIGYALGNLLENALTYTDRGGRITLSASVANGSVTLTVADTGKGIPAEYLPHIYDKFFRIPGHSVEGGTGLGLAIVREIVIAHGGSIDCESQPGVGTVFHIHLPIWNDARGQKSGPPKDGAGSSTARQQGAISVQHIHESQARKPTPFA
jgi:two-component system, NtrC family, sensor histidine kinase KinB